MDTKRTVAKRIKLARIERDLNQAQLAELLGTSQTYVTKLESGKVNIGVETVARLATVLNKPINYFFETFEEPLPKGESPGARAKKRKAA